MPHHSASEGAAPASSDFASIIETIDERLSTIERLLQDLTLSLPAATASQSSTKPPEPPSSSRRNERPSGPTVLQGPEGSEAKRTPEFEGESSFSAHSLHASALFENAMKRVPFAHVPMMSHALSALQDIIKRQSLPSSVNVLRFPGQTPKERIKLSDLELPPSNAVLALLRLANDHPPLFFLTLPVMDTSRFTQMCKDLYFCTEEYSSGRFGSVNAILAHIFKEFAFRFKDDPATTKFQEYSDLCMTNFIAVISSFDIFTEPTVDNLMALTYAIDTSNAYHKAHIQWIVPASELTYNLMATIIQRAAPPSQPPETPSGLNLQCVQAARKALQIHQQIFVSLEKADSFFFNGYITWVLLQCPFAPFMVTFCHTIAASDLEDLNLLGEVATSLQAAAGVSEAADRLYRLCLVFYQVAKLYVDVQPKEPHDYPVIPKPGEEFDDYLTSLGFGPNTLTPSTSDGNNITNFNDPADPSMASFQIPTELMDTDMSHTFGDWFLDNQYMMGLLDSDL
ncbi:fungal specific transcription factor domain-containing protein [Arthroderma uncinatum]|uniref:fungal specific transcription factor domain-containing protein n=1 Tax=Arthroderma uncinatum TaxID=74035 RepID=UPI00144AABA1|nr:fungal specific transcription factor domain-containing protein [Arthroderma uncinatum]KAF3492001.1 fungal specific transcription factor domain-containing protein [Arthroderma uncinatum]